jgi:hypothetical protein
MTKAESPLTISRPHLNKLRRVFAERERRARELTRSQHQAHLEFLAKRGLSLENLRDVGASRIAAGALAGALVLNPLSAPPTHPTSSTQPETGQVGQIVSVYDTDPELAQALKAVVPAGYSNLTPAQEQAVSAAIEKTIGIKAIASLDGHRLNRSFGLIGAEQHLYRYPGDNIFEQLSSPSDFAMYGGAGIAPNLGAYGYWARSKNELTPQMAEQERWYLVAQTFLAPGFQQNPRATADFFKYRKFIVINPDTGQAVVGDLADAGPSEYTGKSFGASPEVINFIGYGSGSRKGRVIFFFVDDPQNKIPLGPVGGAIGGK